MALHAALKQLIETKLAHTHEPQWALPITEVREAFRNLWTPAITGELVSIRHFEDVTIPGVDTLIPTRVYAPDRPEPCPLMLYFHGGGYVKGGIEESDAFCRNLARVTRHMTGKEPLPGGRRRKREWSSRVTEEYWERQNALNPDVAKARKRLNALRAGH